MSRSKKSSAKIVEVSRPAQSSAPKSAHLIDPALAPKSAPPDAPALDPKKADPKPAPVPDPKSAASGGAKPPSSLERILEAMLAEVRALAPGSDVEGFLEERLPEINRKIRETAARTRADDQAAASSEADFPPSGVPEVRRRHASGQKAKPPSDDPVGRDRL